MKRSILYRLSTVTILIILSTILGTEAGAENNAKGTLTVNDEIFQLKYAYVYEQEDELVVALTDNPVSQENVPFDLGDLAYEGKIHGLSVGISKQQKNVKTDSAYHAIYHKIFLGRGALADPGKLRINRFDGKTLDAVLTIDKPVAFKLSAAAEKPKYCYDVAFKVDLSAEAEGPPKQTEVTVTGDDSPAGKAYASYYKAKLAGDIDEVKKWVVKEHVKDLDSEMGRMMIKMSMKIDPKKVNIIKTDISGNSAKLTVKGTTDAQSPATGTVKMVLENGHWKVDIDKWDLTK